MKLPPFPSLLLVFFIVTIQASCTSVKTIRYSLKKGLKYHVVLPYDKHSFEGIQGDGIEHRFWFPDSSVFYITSMTNTLNYDQIRASGNYGDWFLSGHVDTLMSFSGEFNKMHWRDERFNDITVGYSNVPERDTAIFNRSIASFKIR